MMKNKRITFVGNFNVDYSSETHHVKSLEALGYEVVRLQEGVAKTDDILREGLQSAVVIWVHTHGWETTGEVAMNMQEKTTWSDVTFLALCEAAIGIAKVSELSDVYRLVQKHRQLTEEDTKVVDGRPAYKHKVRAAIMRFKNQGIVRSPARGRYAVEKSSFMKVAEKRRQELCREVGISGEKLEEIQGLATVEERIKALLVQASMLEFSPAASAAGSTGRRPWPEQVWEGRGFNPAVEKPSLVWALAPEVNDLSG